MWVSLFIKFSEKSEKGVVNQEVRNQWLERLEKEIDGKSRSE